MKKLCLLLCFLPLAYGAHVTILRDEYGVPHIFAQDAAGAAFGSGYAQAEDRLEEMLKNYRRAEGTMAEAFGAEFFRDDWRQRVWRHRLVAEQHYKELRPRSREIIEAFQAGVRQYMQEHPGQVPAWAPKLEPWQLVALGRYIIWGWPEGEAAGKLLHAGIQPDPIAYHGSNEMLLAPSRTGMHAPIAVVDPHLSWYGAFRFYEMRLYGGDLAFSGACILGLPFPVLGHSRYASIAMTTGGPDTSDVYEEEVKDGKYKFRDEWRPLETRREKIGVKVGDKIDWKDITIDSTVHGPIVAHKNGKSYSVAIPYADEVRLIDTPPQFPPPSVLGKNNALPSSGSGVYGSPIFIRFASNNSLQNRACSGDRSYMSSRRNVFFASGGGLTGNGCVFEVTSPGTAVWGTGRSSIPYTGSPVRRSNTNNKPIFVISATAGMTRPPRRMSNKAGGAARS